MDYLRHKFTSWLCILLCISKSATTTAAPKLPNIVFIMSDDMGWNDVSYHGSDQILTPNIDALAYQGVSLQRYYSNSVCSPSRAALLTSKYAHRMGMQGYPLTNSEDRGIPLSEKLLPAYLKDLGYRTHLVGKWHVGASRTSYLPTQRGFDSHFGFRAGSIDYYEYIAEETWPSELVSGFDLYRNLTAAWDVEGYVTDILTKEAVQIIEGHDTSSPMYLHLAHAAPHSGQPGALLQAPPAAVRTNRHVLLPERRMLAGMMSKLDDGIGAVVKALSDKNILNNTIIVFVADNGGMTSVGETQNWASNWPLRGEKFSPFEGGVRVTGLIWSSLFSGTGHMWSGMMHVTDWLPTLLSAVGGQIPENIDGIDQWRNILELRESTRNKTVVEINDTSGFGAMISGDYKIVTGIVDEVSSRQLSGDLQGVIGPVPSYLEVLKASAAYEAVSKMGRSLDVNKVQDMRTRMKINCAPSDEDMCVPNKDKPCLYNIVLDPCEQHDLSASLPQLSLEMRRQLQEEWDSRVPRTVPVVRDPASDPRLHNNTWAPWIQD